VVLALSASGETVEILELLATIKRLQVPLITMTGDETCANPHPSTSSGQALSNSGLNGAPLALVGWAIRAKSPLHSLTRIRPFSQ